MGGRSGRGDPFGQLGPPSGGRPSIEFRPLLLRRPMTHVRSGQTMALLKRRLLAKLKNGPGGASRAAACMARPLAEGPAARLAPPVPRSPGAELREAPLPA